MSFPPPPPHGAPTPSPRSSGRLPGVGARLGRFRVLGLLGRGGMGAVYRAFDEEAGREVALKLVTPSASSTRDQRFRREGEITAGLSHPGIVRVFSFGELEGRPYLAYELVEGARTLDAVLPDLPLHERVARVVEAARALGHAHARGVTHRDVKPENILVDEQGRVRVADFGLASAQDLERLTQTGAMLGTPSTMAPEQVLGETARIGPPADVWALGVILYQAISGRLPFDGESFFELAAQIASAAPPPLRTADGRRPPAALLAIVLQALEKDPDERYPHGDALADDLEAYLAGRPVSAPSRSGLRAAWTVIGRRSSAWLIALCGALGVAFAAIGYVVLSPTALSPTSASGPGSTPATEPPRATADASPAPAGPLELWRAAGAEPDPFLQYKALRAWLERFPEHRFAGDVRERLAAARRAPLLRMRQANEGGVNGVFTGPQQLLSWVRAEGWRWDLADPREPIERWKTGGRIVALVPTDEGFYVAHARALLRYGADPTPLATTPFEPSSRRDPEVLCMALFADGRRALVGASNEWVYLVDLTGEAQPRNVVNLVSAGYELSISPDETRFVTLSGSPEDRVGMAENGLDLWTFPAGERLREDFLRSMGRAVTFSPDGADYAVGTSLGEVLICDARDGSERLQLRSRSKQEGAALEVFGIPSAHRGVIVGAQYSRDGSRLYTGSRGDTRSGLGNELRVWDARSGQELWAVERLMPAPRSLDLAPDGRWLLVGTEAGTVDLWAAE